MMNWGKLFKPMVFCCALASAGCLPEANYPDEPIVEFVSFEVDDLGSGSLIFNVTDGDGDLGLNSDDVLFPFCPTCEHYYNLKCEYDELRDGVWTHIFLDPEAGQVPFYYRVPRANPSGSNQAINGVVEVAMNTWHLQSDYDTLRFRFTIEDRALNLSNQDTTRIIVK
tara:strand:+ start:901 stop:1404 length:504 start_codon:yes stop_codon:yes gene_type:complete